MPTELKLSTRKLFLGQIANVRQRQSWVRKKTLFNCFQTDGSSDLKNVVKFLFKDVQPFVPSNIRIS